MQSEDLFVEVDHGPFLVDNNLFLSAPVLLDMSEGGAYVHNLFAGRDHATSRAEPRDAVPQGALDRSRRAAQHRRRRRPVLQQHLCRHPAAWPATTRRRLPVYMSGNVFLHGATPSKLEQDPLVQADFDPGIKLVEDKDGVHLHITLDAAWGAEKEHALVTTELLGRAKIPDLPVRER